MKQLITILSILVVMLAVTIVYETPMEATGEVILDYSFEDVEEVPEEDLEDNEVDFENDYQYYKMLITTACKVNGVENIDVAIAISILETGWWENIDEHWNFGGLTVNGKVLQYERESIGVDKYAKCLRWYQDNGMTTPEEMQKTYCPANNQWASRVRKIMEECE